MVRGRGVARRQVLAALALTVLAALTGCGGGHQSPEATVSDAGRDTTIMIIRHGEKPGHGEQGVDEAGRPDKKSLTRRGWRRADALPRLFAAEPGRPAPKLPRPATLFAAADTGPHAGAHRMRQTVTPLSKALHLPVDTSVAEGQETRLATAALAAKAPVLISWEHSRIPAIVRALGAAQARGVPGKWPERFDLVWEFTRTGGNWAFRSVPQHLLDGDE
ncbi:hypothetical protein [Streptomyces sp. NBC_01304]|uniref:hypothetical protein n=1 Tax=Streptomyces sp. NBC_01304 TaxID=2903818 RepID=UPI002E15162E|nr:hypothetical protein OG430_06605 [Streptomyces sp. NBC_01304]